MHCIKPPSPNIFKTNYDEESDKVKCCIDIAQQKIVFNKQSHTLTKTDMVEIVELSKIQMYDVT